MSDGLINADVIKLLPLESSIDYSRQLLPALLSLDAPTEGVWGLACVPTQSAAVARIIAIKGRDASKGLLLIGACPDVFADELGGLATDALRERVKASWPGPHTWVLPNIHYGEAVTGGRDTVACRVPGHEQALALCAAVGGPLVSTSANRTGKPACTTLQQVLDVLQAEVDLVLEGSVNDPGAASAIYDLDGTRLR